MTLTTDYGYGAGFVGALHAVAFGIAPSLSLIDLDHTVPPQGVRLGALRLERFMRIAPPGVHVGIVDPGVGGSRRAIAIEAGRHGFVGPDNGLLLWAAEATGPGLRAVVLDQEAFWLADRSRTFDGRDVFVPVAAHLARGALLADVGTEVDLATLVRLARPVARVRADGVAEVEVLQVDGFGNVQTSGDAGTVAGLGLHPGDRVAVGEGNGRRVAAIYGATFADVTVGETVMLIDSDGCLALSVNCGRADQLFGGDRVPALTISRQ
jgi:S-adenosylmethionine hydrolase